MSTQHNIARAAARHRGAQTSITLARDVARRAHHRQHRRGLKRNDGVSWHQAAGDDRK